MGRLVVFAMMMALLAPAPTAAQVPDLTLELLEQWCEWADEQIRDACYSSSTSSSMTRMERATAMAARFLPMRRASHQNGVER